MGILGNIVTKADSDVAELASLTAPAGTTLIGHGAGATVATILDGTINRGVLSGLVVTDEDLASCSALAIEIKADMIRHAARATRHTTGAHSTVVLAAVPIVANWQTLMTSAAALLTWYEAHNVDMIAVGPSYHSVTGTGHALASAVAPTGITTCVARLNDLKAKYNLHEAETVGHATLGTVAGDEVATTDATGAMHIHWTAGYVYDIATKIVKAISAGSGNCSDDTINYLKWAAGAALTLSSFPASGNEVAVCRIDCLCNEIHMITDRGYLDTTLASLRRSVKAMVPLTTTSGCTIEPHGAGAGILDVFTAGGTYFQEGYEEITVPAIDSNVSNLVRIFHTGAATWSKDYSAFVDPTKYDTGLALAATTANKYYKSLFMIGHNKIHWIYPRTVFNTESDAIAGALPQIPAGMQMHLPVMALVLKGDVTTLPAVGANTWIDVRPRLTNSLAAVLSDHGLLGGLADNDHPQYEFLAELTSIASSATPTPNMGTVGAAVNYNLYALATVTQFATPIGTPVHGQHLNIALYSAATWNVTYSGKYVPIGCNLPATSKKGKWTYLFGRYNTTATAYHIVNVVQQT